MTSCQFYKAVELSYHPSFNMIGKFVFFGILISAPLAITGLKCYQDNKPQGALALNATLCPLSQTLCAITNYDGDKVVPPVRTCLDPTAFDADATWDGCRRDESIEVCYCNTDG